MARTVAPSRAPPTPAPTPGNDAKPTVYRQYFAAKICFDGTILQTSPIKESGDTTAIRRPLSSSGGIEISPDERFVKGTVNFAAGRVYPRTTGYLTTEGTCTLEPITAADWQRWNLTNMDSIAKNGYSPILAATQKYVFRNEAGAVIADGPLEGRIVWWLYPSGGSIFAFGYAPLESAVWRPFETALLASPGSPSTGQLLPRPGTSVPDTDSGVPPPDTNRLMVVS